MNILLCVKQVPDTTEIQIDPVTNTLIRQGVPSILNPFDKYALEMALRLREKQGGKITVITMGPKQAEAVLRECLAMGADDVYLVSDRVFGGSDTLATSYILSCAVKKLAEDAPFDLIFCGMQAIDGDTAQVGPELAEHLKIAQATYVTDIIENKADCITVKRKLDDSFEILSAKKPALITVTKTDYEPRYPNILAKIAAGKREIVQLTSEDLNADVSRAGLKGSPTKVKKTFTPSHSKESKLIKGENEYDIAVQVTEALEKLKAL